MEPVNARSFYLEYHGHLIEELEMVAEHLPGERSCIFLVGDSTMDNKHWLQNLKREPAQEKRGAAMRLVSRDVGSRLIVVGFSLAVHHSLKHV